MEAPHTGLAAFVVILDAAGQVLVAEREDGAGWNLPGGGVMPGESPWDAARRETREEVGVEIELLRLAGLYHVPQRPALVFCFEARILAGVPAALEETLAVAWHRPDALPRRMLSRHAERVADVLRRLPQPVLRVQR